jgi:hypothetical protein
MERRSETILAILKDRGSKVTLSLLKSISLLSIWKDHDDQGDKDTTGRCCRRACRVTYAI